MTRKRKKRAVPCDQCGRTFGQRARDQHREDAHTPVISKEGARAVMDAMDDLPDGAYFAMAEELGFEDFAD